MKIDVATEQRRTGGTKRFILHPRLRCEDFYDFVACIGVQLKEVLKESVGWRVVVRRGGLAVHVSEFLFAVGDIRRYRGQVFRRILIQLGELVPGQAFKPQEFLPNPR